jgi:hypothetical protein
MNTIDRYISEVGRFLPRKSRADIQVEIRSSIEDMLEDRGKKYGRPIDEEMTTDVLKEFGSPKKVAASYLPEKYLIGPRIYPLFILVLQIVLTVIGAVALVRLGFELNQAAPGIDNQLKLIGQTVLESLSGALQALGNIVLVFVILERFLPDLKMDEDEDWDPRELRDVSEPDQVRLWEPIIAIVFTAAALIIFNFYPHLLGIGFVRNGQWTFIPALSEAFFRYLPWINVVWILQIILQLVLLRRGGWEAVTRWFSIAIQLIGIGIAYALLQEPSIIAFTAETLAGGPLEAQTANMLVLLMTQMAKIALIIAIVVGGFEALRSAYRLITKKSTPISISG